MPRVLHIFLPLGKYLWLPALHHQKEQFPGEKQEHSYTHAAEQGIQFKNLTTNLKKIQKLNAHLYEVSDIISSTLYLFSFYTKSELKKIKNFEMQISGLIEILCFNFSSIQS